MFFGKKQTGFMNQPPAMNMVNQPGTMPDMNMMNHTDMNMMNNTEMNMNHGDMNMMPGMQMQGPGMMNNGTYSASQTQMGYGCDPCGYCSPYYEHTEVEVEKPQPKVYVVKKGDTVYNIAKKYGMDWRELAGYNHLGNPDLIYPGERLFIPPQY